MNSMIADGSDAPWWDDYEYKECPDCEGTGYMLDPFFTDDKAFCRRCDGTGEVKIYL